MHKIEMCLDQSGGQHCCYCLILFHGDYSIEAEANHQTVAEKTHWIVLRARGKGTIEFYPYCPKSQVPTSASREDAAIATWSLLMPQVQFTTNQTLRKKSGARLAGFEILNWTPQSEGDALYAIVASLKSIYTSLSSHTQKVDVF
jgi:hypothetical protein